MNKLKWILIIILAAQSVFADLKPWDVSILFPLKNSADEYSDLIKVSDQENLLPKKYFDLIPFLTNTSNELIYPTLRVMGVRIDPCFTEGHGPVPCEQQIRFIWQPISINSSKSPSTVDASLHVFYKLENDELGQILKKFENLNSRFNYETSSNELNVHPGLIKYGLNSSYGSEFKKILLKAVENKKIQRITFMKLKGMDDIWHFGGLNFSQLENGSEQITKIKIPGTNVIMQEFLNELSVRPDPTQFFGGIFPEMETNPEFHDIIRDSSVGNYTEEQIRTALNTVADFENPLKNNPGTLDCASCHIASSVKEWIFKNQTQFDPINYFNLVKYQSTQIPLISPTKNLDKTNRLRMFGYFNDEAFIAPRVVNETAEVLKFLKSK